MRNFFRQIGMSYTLVSEASKKNYDGATDSSKTQWKTGEDYKTDEFVIKFRKHMGYKDDYWPDNKSYHSVRSLIAREYALEQPFDTLAREVEGDAVMVLMRNGTKESIDAAKKLGNFMIKNNGGKKKLLDILQKTYIALLHCTDFDASEDGE